MMPAEPSHYASEYGDGLASHLTMAQSALRRMGASDATCRSFAGAYIAKTNLQRLAEDDPELPLRAELCSEIRRHGRLPTVRAHLAELFGGVASSAFHAMIRLAYALDDDDETEIVAALAYWKSAYVALPPLTPDFSPCIPEQTFAQLSETLRELPATLREGLITPRLIAVAANPLFQAILSRSGTPTPEDLPALASLAVRAFAARAGFVALHMMTAVHALRLLLPYIKTADQPGALASFWQCFGSAYVVAGLPALDGHLPPKIPTWDALLAHAIASKDDHVIKATYSAWQEDQRYSSELYRFAAARYAKLA